MINNGERYPSDFEAKKLIIEIGKRMYDKGFVAANDGNITCKVGPNALWTTPTGVSKGFMTQDTLIKVDLNGKVLLGRHKPSSELKMHLRVYKENPEVRAVTHAHPPVATAFAIAGISLDAGILPEAVVQLGTVPVAKYATPGTQEVPDSIAPFVNTHNGVLLANHGALTWGKDLLESYYRLESMEYYANIIMVTGNIIGKQNELSCSQIGELIDIRTKLGVSTGGSPSCRIDEQKSVSNQELQQRVPGMTPIVRPNHEPKSEIQTEKHNSSSLDDMTLGKISKEEIISEVVRRVTRQVQGKEGN